MTDEQNPSQTEEKNTAAEPNAFEAASAGDQTSLVGEFIDFLSENKKFWMIPLLVALFGLGALILLGGTSAAPFIYTLF
ncbi:MAG: hypothetical protein CMO80_09395 [Verrucomicrobiales bacterium]|nr:hypothetical protein [Verrucomicrobiales bacterium]|tara:strand:- start:293 stop:529 length:237 start_codon:yes stop_codon:yes gene_type:complete